MDFLKDFKLHVIFLIFPIILEIGYVKAQGEYGIKSSCVVPQSYIGDTAIITCDFSVDLFKESKSFRVYRYDLTSSGRKNEQTVLECYFRDFGVPDCGSTAPGYEFNGTFNNQVTVTIPKATLAFQGRYECRAEPSYPKFIDDCVFLIIDRPATSIAVVDSSSGQSHDNENTDGTGKTAGITLGSLLFLAAIGAAVVLFLLWKWNRIRLSCIKAKPREQRNDEEIHYETSMRLLNLEQSTQAANQGERSEEYSVSRHEETTCSGQYTVGVDVVGLNNQTEHDNLKTDCMAEEIDKTKPVVGESTEGEEHTATHAEITPDSVDPHDSQSSTLGKTKTESMILQDSADAVSNGLSGKDQGPVPEVLLTTVDETTKNKEELERPASTPISCGKEDPSGIGHRTAKTAQLCFDPDGIMSAPQGALAAFSFSEKSDVSGRSNEATAAHGEAPNTTHMDDSIHNVQQPQQPSNDTVYILMTFTGNGKGISTLSIKNRTPFNGCFPPVRNRSGIRKLKSYTRLKQRQ